MKNLRELVVSNTNETAHIDPEVEWAGFLEKWTETADALEVGASHDGPLIKWKSPNPKAPEKVVPYVVIGYGQSNYWFENGIHEQKGGIKVEEDTASLMRDFIPQLENVVRPMFNAKIEALSKRGSKGSATRRENAEKRNNAAKNIIKAAA